MDDWTILGITATDDPDIIRQAYMKQLKLHNPEDDPEGFRRVREAYERLVKQLSEAKEEDNTPAGRFMARVEAVYGNFETRTDAQAWKALLDDEACMRLDLEDETNTRLLRFFMEHYYIPKIVWNTLNAHFDWPSRGDALKRDFPGNFIDFLLNSLEHESLDYTLFEYDSIEPPEAAVYDRWIYLYYEMDSLANQTADPENNTFEEMRAELEALPLRHVYYELMCTRLLIRDGKTDEALTAAEALADRLPGDAKAQYTRGSARLAAGRPDEAEPDFRALLDKNPHDFGARRGLIDSLLAKELYDDARTELLTILDQYPFNPYALNTFHHVNDKLIALYEEKHSQNPDDHTVSLTLAKHYLNGYQYAECRALLESFEPAEDEPRYYEFLADCYANARDYERAVALYEKNVSQVREYHNHAKYVSVLLDAGLFEKALTAAGEALAFEDDDSLSKAYLHDNQGQALHQLERYEEALAAFDVGLSINSQTAFIYMHKAKTLQKMNRYAEAIENCERAVGLYPYLTEAYTIQMEIFYDADLYDRMTELADLAEQYNFESPRVKYFKACALRMKDEAEQSEKLLKELLEAEFDEGYRDYFHAELAYIALARRDYETALRHMSEAVRLNAEPVYRHTFLGNIHRLREAYDDALALYNGLVKQWPNFVGALMGRGNVYFDMKDYEHALADFQAALAINENNEHAFDRVIDTYLAENRYTDALSVAEREQSVFDNMENLLRLAWLYDKTDQSEAAEAAYKNAVEQFSDSERPFSRYGYYCKNTLFQYDTAVEMFKKSLALNPEQTMLYSEIAYCLCQLKRYEEALALVDEALARFADVGDLYIRRGLVLSNLRRHEESLRDLLKGMEYETDIRDRWNMPYLFNRIGMKYEMYMNDAENAQVYYQRALHEDAGYADALKNLGDLYRYHFKKHAQAVRYYDSKIALEPEAADGYLAKALAEDEILLHSNLARANYKKALALYEKELREDPDDICLYTHIADCLLGLGELKRARAFYLNVIEKALSGDRCEKKQCDEAYFGMGRLCEKQGQLKEALEYYERAVRAVNSVQYNQARDRLRKKLKG